MTYRSSTVENIKPRTKTDAKRGGWHGTALVVEALLILVVVVACLAVFVRLFGFAFATNWEDQHRAQAIILASNQAERFAADYSPNQEGAFVEETNGYTITRVVTAHPTERGVLYSASIAVDWGDTPLYQLDTAHYVSNDRALKSSSEARAGE